MSEQHRSDGPVDPPPRHPPTPGGPGQGGDPPATPWTPPTGWSPQQPPPWPGGGAAVNAPPGAAQPGPPQPPPPVAGWQPPPPGNPGVAGPNGAPRHPAPGSGWPTPAAGWPVGWPTPVTPTPRPGIVPLRPLGVGEILEGALGLIRSNPRTVLGMAAGVAAISALLETLGLLASFSILGGTELALTPDSAAPAAELTSLVASGLVQLAPAMLAGLLQTLASGLFMVLVAAAVLGHQLDAGRTWALLRPRLAALTGLTVLIGLAVILALGVGAGLIVLLVLALGPWAILPGLALGVLCPMAVVYLYIRLFLAAPALVIERLGVVESLRRSWSLVRGSWWRVLGIGLLTAILTGLLSAIITVPMGAVAAILSAVSGATWPLLVLTGLASLLAGMLTLPFGAAVTGLLYTDLRMRREALDIQLATTVDSPDADPLAAYRVLP